MNTPVIEGTVCAGCGQLRAWDRLYGFPPEAFPIIATIGFLVDPAATMVNATGDTCSAMLVTRMVEGRDWFDKAVTAKEIF